MKRKSEDFAKEMETKENRNKRWDSKDILGLDSTEFINMTNDYNSFSSFIRGLKERGFTEFQIGYALCMAIVISKSIEMEEGVKDHSYIG